VIYPAARVWRTVPLCCLAAVVEGFDIQSMGVAAPAMAPALHLTRDQLGPAFSASTVGLLIGAILVGRMADLVGRKAVLMGSLAIFGVFSLATAYVADVNLLLVIRLLAGLGLGGAMPNLMALSAESVPEARRAPFVAIAAAAMPLGGAVASGVAASLDWRLIFLIGGLGPLALAAVMAPVMPESEGFLATRRGPAGARPPPLLAALFGGGRGLASVFLWIAAFAALLALYMLLNWLPLLMTAKGASKAAASLVALAFNVGGAMGALAIAGLFRGQRRAPTLAVWFVGMAVSVVALAWAPAALAAAASAGFAAGFFISSCPTALYAVASDFYPVEMRATGLGAVVGVGRIGAIVGPLLASALLAGGASPATTLMALPPFVAVSAAATVLVLIRRARIAPAPARA
jgi:AAHS family 3-hydroxyphenylpropionic acid transporter